MTLNDIPADLTQTLNAITKRLFEYAGCSPGCHACHKPILIGSDFTLVSLDGTDEMLCTKCDREALVREKQRQRRESARANRGGYSRPSLADRSPS